MYRNDAEVSPTSPQQNVGGTVDPFYDRFPWFRLLGRSVLVVVIVLVAVAVAVVDAVFTVSFYLTKLITPALRYPGKLRDY